MISGPWVELECEGCNDEEIIAVETKELALAHIESSLGWRHTGTGLDENDSHYCAACRAHMKARKSDDELADFGLTPEEAKQLEI